jgi:hypothetical protein
MIESFVRVEPPPLLLRWYKCSDLKASLPEIVPSAELRKIDWSSVGDPHNRQDVAFDNTTA